MPAEDEPDCHQEQVHGRGDHEQLRTRVVPYRHPGGLERDGGPHQHLGPAVGDGDRREQQQLGEGEEHTEGREAHDVRRVLEVLRAGGGLMSRRADDCRQADHE